MALLTLAIRFLSYMWQIWVFMRYSYVPVDQDPHKIRCPVHGIAPDSGADEVHWAELAKSPPGIILPEVNGMEGLERGVLTLEDIIVLGGGGIAGSARFSCPAEAGKERSRSGGMLPVPLWRLSLRQCRHRA
ncbi:hypothetical protein VTN49DRAFT_7262 [Thermomyces lanuginosus]|uniref:uncharacterized protein n=1 Tax=Thermomyces lanuginosus TaxID=5541 RepID=UPI003742A784